MLIIEERAGFWAHTISTGRSSKLIQNWLCLPCSSDRGGSWFTLGEYFVER